MRRLQAGKIPSVNNQIQNLVYYYSVHPILQGRLNLCFIIFSGNAGSTNRCGGNPADAGHHALAVLVPDAHLTGGWQLSKIWRYWFPNKKCEITRRGSLLQPFLPGDEGGSQFMLKRSRESTGLKVFLQIFSQWDIFDLQNTSFFLGLSRIPLSSAAMATIPLEEELSHNGCYGGKWVNQPS